LSFLKEDSLDALSNTTKYTIMAFLAIWCLRPDGSWDPPADITPKMARLQWGFKAVVFTQCLAVLDNSNEAITVRQREE
jgi:hypothetical protein